MTKDDKDLYQDVLSLRRFACWKLSVCDDPLKRRIAADLIDQCSKILDAIQGKEGRISGGRL